MQSEKFYRTHNPLLLLDWESTVFYFAGQGHIVWSVTSNFRVGKALYCYNPQKTILLNDLHNIGVRLMLHYKFCWVLASCLCRLCLFRAINSGFLAAVLSVVLLPAAVDILLPLLVVAVRSGVSHATCTCQETVVSCRLFAKFYVHV